MAPTRRKFTLEFRIEAAHRVIDSGRSVTEVAREILMAENSLFRWVRDRTPTHGSEPAVSLVPAGLGLAAAELTSSAAWCVTREPTGPVRVPFPGSARSAWLTTSTRSFIFMA